MTPLPYREFQYPLNVFMHILTHEEGSVPYLHYGLFESPDEPLAVAQERSTRMLLDRLPPPPASILEVGIGLGTMLNRLAAAGYDVTGITPDETQIAMVHAQFGERLRVRCSAFETFDAGRHFDVVLFQESSQYIPAEALFAKAAALTERVLVLDEFALGGTGLHAYDSFLAAAHASAFEAVEEVELSGMATPTMDYFKQRLTLYRDRLIADLGIESGQVDDLIESGARYRDSYARGDYVYRLLDLKRSQRASG